MNGGRWRRASLAAATTAVLSLTAAGTAVAAPVARPAAVPRIGQVTGSALETALLPPSAFGKDYQETGATDTGGSLRPASPAQSVRAAYCADIEGGGSLAGYGDTAQAYLAVISDSGDVQVYQDVAQFPSGRAARSFFTQVLALYRRCGTFFSAAGFVPIVVVLPRGGITTTSVHGYPAFRVRQVLQVAEQGNQPFGYVHALFFVAGVDVYEVMVMASSSVPVPGWMPAKLISRVRALYR
jgi:hypothetical protein